MVLGVSEGIAIFAIAFCTRQAEDKIRKILALSEHSVYAFSEARSLRDMTVYNIRDSAITCIQ